MSKDKMLPPLEKSHGTMAWMVHNRVTPNLLMLVLMLGGLLMATRIKQEVFPEFTEDMITISMAYPGASPAEVEQSILLVIEEAVRGVDGVQEVTATAREGSGQVNVELEVGIDQQQVYQDIKQEVDSIRTFPQDAEEVKISINMRRRQVLTIQIYGDVDEWSLRNLTEDVRDQLLQDPEIAQVDLRGARDFEVLIEPERDVLRAHGLTLQDLARIISQTAVEVPAGGIKTTGGEILLRVDERRDWATEFADIPIITTPDGAVLHLSDIATVRDDFEDSDAMATYNGKRAIGLSVFRIGDQTPIGVADATFAALEKIEADLPEGVSYAINRDMSEIYRQRLGLLLRNAFWGLCLVLLVLGIFLEFKLAFWVTMGIPISFLGGLLFLPGMGVTINMISMFAFIIALGIVVDDAIVAGENIYEYRQKGMSLNEAAIQGARDVAIPITFSILTNIIAFLPLLFLPGTMGKMWKVIPVVVITVFSISLFEALFILPSHLAHTKTSPHNVVGAMFHRWQQAFSRLFMRMVERIYGPFLDFCIRYRYVTIAIATGFLIVVLGYVQSGRMGMVMMPKVESDHADVTAMLPYGSAMPDVLAVRDKLVSAAEEVMAENGGEKLAKGVFAEVNKNIVEMSIYLTKPEERPIGTAAVSNLWRDKVGMIPGLETLRFESDGGGPGRGFSITVELSHRDIATLEKASQELAVLLEEFDHVKDVDDGYNPGKPQLSFTLKPEGRSLGLTSSEVARQVRYAFYGAEALRQQRGRHEIIVRVRLPESERVNESDIERLLIRTAAGTDVPLMQIANVERGRAYSTIEHRNGRRSLTVQGNVLPDSETNQILEKLKTETLPQLVKDYSGLSFSFEGRQADMRESMEALWYGFIIALVLIFVVLAIPFGSYIQPAIVMCAIPFGIVGAVLGHWLMGYNLSLISMMGIIALAGVVVNDSLVMVVFANEQRQRGLDAHEAIHSAGVRRFRPILLTTLTTFGGLAPMIFETSRQARFMIPMAISLGYGLLFATAITLVLVPCLYLVIEDAIALMQGALNLIAVPDEEDATE